MQFSPELVEGKFLRRYKRFFCDVELPGGETVVTHCTNTGTLLGCLVEGAPVLIQSANNPKRKLKWTWKMVRVGRTWVGVDTGLAVPLVEEAIRGGRIPELAGYERSTREVKYGENSRIDILLSRGGSPEKTPVKPRTMFVGDERVYVEVKSTTLQTRSGKTREGAFPDAVTTRGLKHLNELVEMVKQGHRAAMVYCVTRSDVDVFRPADEIDPNYGAGFRNAISKGVEVYALACSTGPKKMVLQKPLPLQI